jgi:hypothetical protein
MLVGNDPLSPWWSALQNGLHRLLEDVAGAGQAQRNAATAALAASARRREYEEAEAWLAPYTPLGTSPDLYSAGGRHN